MLLTRAWFAAHRGPAALVAGIVVSILFALFGSVSIEIWGAERELPLWAVAPGTLTMIVCTTLDSQLDSLPVEPTWLRAARLLWVAVVIGVGAMLALPTALALGDLSISYATALLVVIAFGPALLDVRLGIGVGVLVDVLAVVYGGQVVGDREMSAALDRLPNAAWPALVLPGIVGLASYVIQGPQRLRPQ